MYCKNCGKQIEDEVKFCPYCGAALDLSTTSPTQNNQHNTTAFETSNLQSNSAAVTDTWIWALAIVPIILITIIEVICTLFGFSDSFLNWGSIGLYAGFIYLDVQELKKKGIKFGLWLYILGTLLVPVYLFVREKKTNHNYVPGIVWCVLFCVYAGIILLIA